MPVTDRQITGATNLKEALNKSVRDLPEHGTAGLISFLNNHNDGGMLCWLIGMIPLQASNK